MILYLSSEQHTNLLDFTGWYDTDSEIPIKKLVGSFVLKQFIIYDMRNFSHFTEVVLDRIAFEDSDVEFAEAIEEFLIMYNPRITVIYEGLKQDDPLFQALLDRGVGNIVCDTEVAAIQREITECLSGQGMMRYCPKERVKKQDCNRKFRFDCENVHIAVISSQPRMGATTAAVGLSAWLAAAGASVCYVEESVNKILSAMAAAYEMKPDGEGWLLDGVRYGATPVCTTTNFVVHDLGHMPDINGTVKGADLLLAVCGTKPYELSNSMLLLHRLEAVDAYVLCPFTDEKVRDDYAAILRSDFHKVLFLEYQPEPTDGISNAQQYQTMMTKYIAGV